MLGVKISRVMEREVIVSYNGRDLRIDIEDVNPGDLRDLFGIDFDVKTLLEVETEKTILVKKKERLKPGFTYVLQRPVQDRQTTSTPQVVKVFSNRFDVKFSGRTCQLAVGKPAACPASTCGVQGCLPGPGH